MSCLLGETGNALVVLLNDKSSSRPLPRDGDGTMAGKKKKKKKNQPSAESRCCHKDHGTGGGSMNHQVIRLNVIWSEQVVFIDEMLLLDDRLVCCWLLVVGLVG